MQGHIFGQVVTLYQICYTKTNEKEAQNLLSFFLFCKTPYFRGFRELYKKFNAFQNKERHQNSVDTILGKDCAAEKIIVKTITRLHKTFVFPYFLRYTADFTK